MRTGVGVGSIEREHIAEPATRTYRFALLGVLFFALGGCVTANATLLGTGPRQPPVPESAVRVYLADETVPETCERYALISLSGDANTTNEAQMIGAARRRAGKVGANALQVSATREPGAVREVAAVLLGVNADRKGEMIAYRCP